MYTWHIIISHHVPVVPGAWCLVRGMMSIYAYSPLTVHGDVSASKVQVHLALWKAQSSSRGRRSCVCGGGKSMEPHAWMVQALARGQCSARITLHACIEMRCAVCSFIR